MKQLLNTLFVVSEDTWLSLEDNNIVVHREDGSKSRCPLLNIENILYFGWKGASPALLGYCAERDIGFCFLNPLGKFLARVCGESRGNVLLRKEQYRLSDDEDASCRISQCMIIGKICNARLTLMRAQREHPHSIQREKKFAEAVATLKASIGDAQHAATMDELRGVEGNAARAYFSVFEDMILANKISFQMIGRTKRPPRDPMNALLSFLYTLLAHDCASALESVGLDSYVGFLHRDRPGRNSLALDLMEELRSPFADRLALAIVNNRSITAKHFRTLENGAVLLNNDGKKILLTQWQEKKRDKITHPFLKEKIVWGIVPYIQALLLAKYVRKDLDGYPAFIWK